MARLFLFVVAALILPPGLLPDVVTSHTTVVAETTPGPEPAPDPCTVDSDFDGIYDCHDACPLEHGAGSADGCNHRKADPEEVCKGVDRMALVYAAIGLGLTFAGLFISGPTGWVLGYLAFSTGSLSLLFELAGCDS